MKTGSHIPPRGNPGGSSPSPSARDRHTPHRAGWARGEFTAFRAPGTPELLMPDEGAGARLGLALPQAARTHATALGLGQRQPDAITPTIRE